MKKSEMPTKQLWAWMAVAVSAPLAHFGGVGWFAVLLASGAMLPLTLLAADGWRNLTRAEAVLEYLWMIGMLAYLLSGSGACWPGKGTSLAVPLTLLLLAGLSGGGEKGARIGGTLSWALILLFLPVLFGGVANIKWEYLEPTSGRWTPGLLLTLLIPGLSGCWTGERRGSAVRTLGLGALAVLLAALIQGILSVGAASQVEEPLYEAGRSVGRFEPVVAVAMTFGWSQLASFLVSTAARLGEGFGLEEKWGRWIACSGAGALLLIPMQRYGEFLTVFGLFFLILVPVLHGKRKSKKIEEK